MASLQHYNKTMLNETMLFRVLYLFSITETHGRVFLEEKKLEKYLSRQEFTEEESQKDVIRH